MYGVSIESEDELLARRLQEEEERSMGMQMSSHSVMSEVSEVSTQEREDRMLARQMQEMDSFGLGGNGIGNNNRVPNPPDHHHGDVYAGFHSPNSPIPDTVSAAGVSREDRLAYARRLQEQAFQQMKAAAKPQISTEESDLELAMKMQIEEGGGAPVGQEDEDLKLARFMEESGVSIRNLDEDGLAAAREGATCNLTANGLPNHNRIAIGVSASSSMGPLGPHATAAGGGLLSGLYGSRGDDSDDDSLEFGVGNSQAPPTVPSSIPAPAPGRSDSVPAGVPASIPMAIALPIPSAATMPAAPVAEYVPAPIPPASPTSQKKFPPSLSPLAPPNGRNASKRLTSIQRGRDFQREVPKPSKSSGARTGGKPTLLERMLPSPSKSFGSPRVKDTISDEPAGLTPSHSQSAHNLMALRNAAKNAKNSRSISPKRRKGKQDRAARAEELDILGDPMFGDLPPGVNMASANDPSSTSGKKKKGKMFSRMFGSGHRKHRNEGGLHPSNPFSHGIPEGIPAAIPGPPRRRDSAGPLPHSVSASIGINQRDLRTTLSPQQKSNEQNLKQKQQTACSVCGGSTGRMLVALERQYHVDCFRCMSCNELLDHNSVFAVTLDPHGTQHALHRKCYSEFYGIPCAVCKHAIPANEDGSVSFIKHPFFNTEQMCPIHADEPGRRRCTGCHRFEPEDEPFTDLNDGDRCVCSACCRSVIMDNMDAKPLWDEVLQFFEFQLGLPIWEEMREVPILVVGQDALNESQLKDGTSAHGDSSQIMTRGLCLSEHEGSMSFRVPSQRFNDSTASFEACNHSGFMDFALGPLKGNSNSEVMAILCLSGLPRDLTASVLAHEATHAWIKLHPDFKVRRSLPVKVEEGCAQLVAYLFLCDGLEEPRVRRNSDMGPSDEKLRQYFKFSIETDDNDIYGDGYRKAALAYSAIGMAALLNHVVHYQEFPVC